MFAFPRLFGAEFAILPFVSFPYLYLVGDFSMPAVLFNNAIVTALCGAVALWRSSAIAKAIGPRHHNRLEPVWPAFAGVLLLFVAALQLILSVTHLSYYREGPLVSGLFEQ